MNVNPQQTVALLKTFPVFASVGEQELEFLAAAHVVKREPGQEIVSQGKASHGFWIVLSGSLRLSWKLGEIEQTGYIYKPGASFGELPLLSNLPATSTVTTLDPVELIEFGEEEFWTLMNRCPAVRKEILGTMAMRLVKSTTTTFQQEKLASLGTLAAGLMHELNNPGSAAKRAASQLRENLTRMHQHAAGFAKTTLSTEQKECLFELQEHALAAQPKPALNSLEQSDAEEELVEWMESAHVPNAWKLAPTLVSVGIDAPTLDCARHTFNGPFFAEALSWLEALVSSMQLVGTIEESIGRVTDLVHAVKSYAYEGRGQKQAIDVNASIHNTLVIMAHKLREKQITLDKSLAPNLPALETGCQGLNQVWTNLLDNAIDASPREGHIGIRTWIERVGVEQAVARGEHAAGAREELCILITDHGEGIPIECQTQIFDPFFTTKPVGVGTGLGLGIVYRIVEQCGGTVRFSSQPGETEFAIRLPVTQ